jgi:two-component sensor histidine kinase/CHASE3 domain sensor protein
MPISGRFVVKYTGLLLAIGFLTLLGIVGMTIWLGERAQTYANDAIQARDTRVSAVELRSAVQSAESAQRGFLVSDNEIYLAPYDSAKASLQRQLDRLNSLLTPYKETEAMLRRLSVIIAEKIDEMDRTIVLKKEQRDSESLSIFRTNRGKALMDEANVFLSSVIRTTDERLTTGVTEQRENAARLRWVSLIGGMIIVLVVGGVTVLGIRYALEIAQARDEVHNLNVNLEQRVKERTSALGQALDRAEVLLAEVNHRVANSLMMVASLVRLQSNALQNQDAKDALAETEARIHAISDVHKRLYSSGDVRLVALDEYLSDLLKNLQSSMQNEGHGASLDYHLEPLKLATDSSINLGVVVTEWVTNAFKYAYPQRRGEVRVNLKRLADGRGELLVEDDGVGRINSGAIKGTGLGTRLVKAMAGNLGGEIDYFARQPGTLARLTFPVPAD